MSTVAPDRSLQQRMDALKNANRIRTYRSNLKKDLKAGRQDILDIMLQPPEELETMKIFDLLLALPKFGRVKANKMLQSSRISPSKTVGGLSQRQRVELSTTIRWKR